MCDNPECKGQMANNIYWPSVQIA